MNKAYKYRIYPNAEQTVMFAKSFGCCRFAYNRYLGKRIELYKTDGKTMNYYECAKDLTNLKKEPEYEWLKEVDSIALQSALENLDTAYQNFFRRVKNGENPGFPKFKSKRSKKHSYMTKTVNGNIKIKDNHIILPKVGGVKIKLHRAIPENHSLKSVTVSKTPSGKYYASILFEYEQAIEPVEINNVVGLDFSMAELYVDSEGNEANYPRYYRRKLGKLKKLSRALSKMVKFSSNWRKQKHKIAILHEKTASQRRDFLHKESRKIANSYDLVGVEDLDMRAMSQALNFGKSVADNAWGMFRTLLKYKLEEAGKHMITIDKWFPSSKKCSTPGCGYVNKDLDLSVRQWACPECGVLHDRDVNAAVNIRNEAVRMVSASNWHIHNQNRRAPSIGVNCT